MVVDLRRKQYYQGVQTIMSAKYDAGADVSFIKQTILRITRFTTLPAVLPMRLGIRVQVCTATVGHHPALLSPVGCDRKRSAQGLAIVRLL